MRRLHRQSASLVAAFVLVLALIPAYQVTAAAIDDTEQVEAAVTPSAANAACAGEDVFYDPCKGEDIVLPSGYKVDVFARDLNFPTGLAFMGTENGADDFNTLIVESGTGLPGRCNNNTDPAWGGKLSATNPFTPDLLVLNDQGNTVGKPHFKPTSTDPAKNTGYQPD